MPPHRDTRCPPRRAVPWTALVLAWSAGVGAASFNLTPGGLGVVEAALAASLVAAHLPATHAMTSVLVYRMISLWLVASVGWCTYALIRRRSARPERHAVASRSTSYQRYWVHPAIGRAPSRS